MAFAAQMAEGWLGPEHCPDLSDENRENLQLIWLNLIKKKEMSVVVASCN